jgi:hypothetical protein
MTRRLYTMAYRQTVARRDINKQAAQAQRLIAAAAAQRHAGIVPTIVQRQTVEVPGSSALVIERTAEIIRLIAGVVIEAGQRYYLMTSKVFQGRYYVAYERDGRIKYSCDERTAMALIAHIIDASMRGAMVGEEIAA